MLRHFTNKGMESRESKLIIKQCIWLNFIGKGHFFFFFFFFLSSYTLFSDFNRLFKFLGPGFSPYSSNAPFVY